MTVEGVTENFIPFRADDLVEFAAAEGRLDPRDGERFQALAQIVSALYHHRFHERLARLKRAFAVFDPDADTRLIEGTEAARVDEDIGELVEEFEKVLVDANYRRIPQSELDHALEESSLIPFSLKVDMDAFASMVLFFRGSKTKEVPVKKGWIPFFKKEVMVPVETLERVVMLVRYKPEAYFRGKGKKLGKLPFQPGKLYVQLFKDIPRADVEVLFPTVRVGMTMRQRALFIIPAVGAGIPILVKVALSLTALLTALAIFLGIEEGGDAAAMAGATAGLTGLLGLFGYLFRQYTKYKSMLTRFLKDMTEQLFFKNLDSNSGVFRTVVDEAEEEENKEAILAYYHLLVGGPATERDLDERIEAWFRDRLDVELDFEVDDALGKLADLGLVERTQDERYVPLELASALRRVDEIWDDLYAYNA